MSWRKYSAVLVLTLMIWGAYSAYIYAQGLMRIDICPKPPEGYALENCQNIETPMQLSARILRDTTLASALHQAKVVFVGNSRIAFGVSTNAVARYFGEHGLRYFVLGFPHNNWYATRSLLGYTWAQPSVLIINADHFLQYNPYPLSYEFRALTAILNGAIYDLALSFHYRTCGTPDCLGPDGRPRWGILRSKSDGHWIEQQADLSHTHTFRAPKGDVEMTWLLKAETALNTFLGSLSVARECVVLTYVPHQGTEADDSETFTRRLAERAGVKVLIPDVSDLRVFDEAHLDPESAERWSQDLIARLAPIIEHCAGAG